MPKGRTQVLHGQIVLTLSTLANNTAILGNTKIDASVQQEAQITKVKVHAEVTGKTAAEGPIIVGLSSGLSNAEIAEGMIADPQRMGDPGSSEQANRKIYPFLVIRKGVTAQAAIPEHLDVMRNISAPSWKTLEEDALSFFAFNRGAALTAGTVITILFTLVIKWGFD